MRVKLTSSPGRDRELITILGGLALFLSVIEYVIPKPIPFIKIGLANIPILLSLHIVKPQSSIKLILIKSLGASLISGTLFSWIFLYSLSGSLISGLIMILIWHFLKRWVSMVGISLLGALSNNLTQISLALLILGPGAIYLGIPILIIGFISGLSIGLLTNNFLQQSQWIKEVTE